MDPSRRSQLREDLRADAGRLAALADRHGTPLLVLRAAPGRRAATGELAARCPDSACTTR